MKCLCLGLAAVPCFVAGVVWAAEPLRDAQMDKVTAAGPFSAFSSAVAQASGKIVTASTATLASVGPVLTPTGSHVTFSIGSVLTAGLPPIIQTNLQANLP